jgi:hypothetical protein
MYLINSRSEKDKVYEVDLCADGGRGTCHCPSFFFRGKCAHLRLAKETFDLRVQAFRAAVPHCTKPEDYGEALRRLTAWV